jgi:hypothetical protein
MTKKTFLTLVMLFGVALHFSQAQYDKGKHFGLVGFSLKGIGSTDHSVYPSYTEDINSSNFGLSLSYKRGTFAKINFAHGWVTKYNLSAYIDNIHVRTGLTHSIGAGYFVDKFIPLSKSLYCYGELQGLLGTSFVTGNDSYRPYSISLTTSLNGGLRYQFKNQWFLNGETNLAQFSLSNYHYRSENTFRVNVSGSMYASSLSLSIGKTF